MKITFKELILSMILKYSDYTYSECEEMIKELEEG